MIATSITTDIPYGAVDSHALQVLESSYDTTRMLAAVETFDAVRLACTTLRDYATIYCGCMAWLIR
jgi:hypothetical protein